MSLGRHLLNTLLTSFLVVTCIVLVWQNRVKHVDESDIPEVSEMLPNVASLPGLTPSGIVDTSNPSEVSDSPTSTSMDDISDSRFPEISEWTRSADPGQSLVIAGAGLDEEMRAYVARLSDGDQTPTLEATVISANGHQAILSLPEDLSPNSVYGLWVENSAGIGEGVLLNSPELWWVGPEEAAPGETLTLYGRDLSLETKRTTPSY